LINKYFRQHLPGVRTLLEQENLTQVADTLSAEVAAAEDSKARMVAAVAKALEIAAEEIRLRRHTTKANGDDEGDMHLDFRGLLTA
jgi:2C-methyl-D-erythritol 2,4-cyclodiphosphate synthase